MTNREIFIELYAKINRDGKAELFEWLEQSDFFTAPASAKYHGSYEGGLVEHSLNVYNALTKLLTIYPEIQVSDESVAIVALFHDLCKVNMYKKEKRYKNRLDHLLSDKPQTHPPVCTAQGRHRSESVRAVFRIRRGYS